MFTDINVCKDINYNFKEYLKSNNSKQTSKLKYNIIIYYYYDDYIVIYFLFYFILFYFIFFPYIINVNYKNINIINNCNNYS